MSKLQIYRDNRDNKRLADASIAKLLWALSEKEDSTLFDVIRESEELRTCKVSCDIEHMTRYDLADGSIMYIDNDYNVWTEDEYFLRD